MGQREIKGLQDQVTYARKQVDRWSEALNDAEDELARYRAAEAEPEFGAVIMFCYEYANGAVGTIVAIRAQDTGQWKTTSRRTSRPAPLGVSWGTMQDLFPAIKSGHWVRLTAEKGA